LRSLSSLDANTTPSLDSHIFSRWDSCPAPVSKQQHACSSCIVVRPLAHCSVQRRSRGVPNTRRFTRARPPYPRTRACGGTIARAPRATGVSARRPGGTSLMTAGSCNATTARAATRTTTPAATGASSWRAAATARITGTTAALQSPGAAPSQLASFSFHLERRYPSLSLGWEGKSNGWTPCCGRLSQPVPPL
jgi:hypothetical protein